MSNEALWALGRGNGIVALGFLTLSVAKRNVQTQAGAVNAYTLPPLEGMFNPHFHQSLPLVQRCALSSQPQ